jgi:hypothetical protein
LNHHSQNNDLIWIAALKFSAKIEITEF